MAIRSKALSGEGNDLLDVSDGAHGGEVKLGRRGGARQFFQPLAADADLVETAGAGSFFKEGALFRHRFEEGDGKLGKSDLQGQAGEAGATADVEQGAVELEVPRDEKAFTEVAGHAFFRRANGREVDFLVPTKQQIEIGKDLVHLAGREIQVKRFQQLAEAI